MSDFVEINVAEVSRLGAAIAGNGTRVGATVSAVVRASGARIEALAKAQCPVDTGNLRNSISMDIVGSGRAAEMSVEVGPTANYGVYVEDGTSRMAPQPYMGPAFDQVAPQFVSAIQAAAAAPL